MAINNAINKVLSSSPTAGAVPLFDSNAALSANSMNQSATAISRTNGGTYVLTMASTAIQIFTGNASGGTDYVQTPATNTLVLGQSYLLINTSTTDLLNVYNSSFDQIAQLSPGSSAEIICVSTAVDNATSWSVASALVKKTVSTTPTITFATPGNLSVSYSSAFADLHITGNLAFLKVFVRFTPTYTTASGNFIIQNLPVGMADVTTEGIGGVVTNNGNASISITPIAYPASCTSMVPVYIGNFGSPIINLYGMGNGVATTILTTAQFPTATAKYLGFTLMGWAN